MDHDLALDTSLATENITPVLPARRRWLLLGDMSIVGNQPRTAPRPASRDAGTRSARLARFGVPVPPRIVELLDGPELARYEGARGWGFPGWSADTKLKVRWASPRLAAIHDYAIDVGHDEAAATRFLPLAAVGSEHHMFAVDVTDAALPVYFFDHESGFARWADSFDAFLDKLLKRDELTPSERLAHAHDEARQLHADKRYAEILALLEPLLAAYPIESVRVLDDTSEYLGAAYNLVGIAREHTGDIAGALAAYEQALGHGADSAGLNICDLWLNHFKDYGKLVEYAETRRARIYAFADKYAWFHVRNYLGQGYLLTGRPRDAMRAYHQILEMFAVDDPGKIEEAVTDLRQLVTERPETDRATAEAILAWLAAPPLAPPGDRLASLRAWWSGLPEAVASAIRTAAHIASPPDDASATPPSDADLARVVELRSLDVKHAELRDLTWVAPLTKLEALDLEDNELRDLAPLATLQRLRRLDVARNKLKHLRGLAPLIRLERLHAGENPITSLDGLEGLRQLTELQVSEARLSSLEPLRDLPDLIEVTIFHNRIADLSPLASCPRIKKIMSFGNPIETGLAALAALPWLETVDAGDRTPASEVRALRVANPHVEIDHFDSEADDEDEAAAPRELAGARAWWRDLSDTWRDRLRGKLDRDERDRPEPSDEALQELVREDSLRLDDQPLPDLEPLRRLTRLDYLNLGNTGITDLTAIAELPRLRDLIVRDNPLASLAPLARARVLEELYAERCRLTSLAGLEGCRALRELHAEDNQLEDLAPLAELAELRVLDLEGNHVTSVAPLARLPRLHTVRLGLNRIAELAPLAGCRALRVVEIWGNPRVRGALALAELPELERVISHRALPADELAELARLRPDVVID
jgi:Leucine-rich repeat (LRR) protein